MLVGRGGALVESTPFVRMVMDSTSAPAPHRDPEQVLNSQFPVALRREIPAQYPLCVGKAVDQSARDL